ncbi:MAG TPA: tRNA preQ1(34) S-adenosylmethionine ribosyltransferase-isomerase QueA [Firmicutes bacterium]|nr:tRNA preQ1(34) S-adenosylmethionine ribosyltransferase-isomerase QueA [Bacillota bacterium]
MKTEEFDYPLPEELIAQIPIPDRDKSRLLVVNRKDGTLSHRMFKDVAFYVSPGDVLVTNNTRVIPARLFGRRKTGGKVEILLLNPVGRDLWECLVKPGGKARPGEQVFIGRDENSEIIGTVEARTPFGGRLVRFSYQGKWEDVLERVGNVPLPPYIKVPLKDPERYQTVYARIPGSAAAPTAGLHFTPELLSAISARGISVAPVTLNVGLGTFRPVTEENIERHQMHKEYFEISENTASEVNRAKTAGRRILAVGTTAVRALESACDTNGIVSPYKGDTDIFIYPGFQFRVVDCLITNFHLPKSTLLMLVCAFAGKDLIMEAYREAVKEKYRFFSFGDAMLVL